MQLLMFLFVAIVTTSGTSGSPISPRYSSRYSKVLYQGLSERPENTETEQTTLPTSENPSESDNTQPTLDKLHPTSDTLIPNQITTEPESEQIDFVFFPKQNENIELVDEIAEDEETDKALEEVDSNREGIYYIYHPNGLLQKVVYGRRDENKNGIAQIQLPNVVPIIETVFTYDPSTFVFQRLQLFTG